VLNLIFFATEVLMVKKVREVGVSAVPLFLRKKKVPGEAPKRNENYSFFLWPHLAFLFSKKKGMVI